MLSLNVAFYLIGLVIVVWSFIDKGAVLSVIILAVWTVLLLSLKKYRFGIPVQMIASAFVLIASVVTILVFPDKDSRVDLSDVQNQNQQEENGQIQNEEEQAKDPEGTILVNGIEGTLEKGGLYSNISNIERDNGFGEAYLGDDGATARYLVQVKNSGSYRLLVRLSDDGIHLDGARNATVVVNGGTKVQYLHTSEDTKGWKWYDLGSVTLQGGENTISFVKDPNTMAAYVMNQFKLLPLE